MGLRLRGSRARRWERRGEHSAILFNTRRLTLLDNGDFWFSETPKCLARGGMPPVVTAFALAKFKEVETGAEFFVFNAHYDHEGKVAGTTPRCCFWSGWKNRGGYPLFATGDFNAVPEAEPIQLIYDSGKLNDSYLVTLEPPYGTVGTFNSFSLEAPMKNRIDYIWVTPGITVERYGVLHDMQHGRFPSDHFPVVIDASF